MQRGGPRLALLPTTAAAKLTSRDATGGSGFPSRRRRHGSQRACTGRRTTHRDYDAAFAMICTRIRESGNNDTTRNNH